MVEAHQFITSRKKLKAELDYSLCIVCQTKNAKEKLAKEIKDESIENEGLFVQKNTRSAKMLNFLYDINLSISRQNVLHKPGHCQRN